MMCPVSGFNMGSDTAEPALQISLSNETLDSRFDSARAILGSLRRVAVALSGGVDSGVVLMLAAETLGRENVLAVTGISDSLAAQELEDAGRLAARANVEHIRLETREFSDPNYLANPTNRCYHCKTELYTRMAEALESRGPYVIVNGTNADDLGDFRPGLTAAREREARAPPAEAGLPKADERALAACFDPDPPEKPASPCLSSRVQY